MLTKLGRAAGRVAVMLAALWAVMVGIGLLLTKVLDHSWLRTAEDKVNETLAAHRTAELDGVTYWGSGLGSTAAVVTATVVVAIGLRLAFKRWNESVFLVLAVAGQALVFLGTTLVISRPRPDVERLDDAPPTSSFPSGHTGASTALFIASALLVAWYVRNRVVKVIALTLLVAGPLFVAYSRLYRGMHHPTDIAGAYVNGLSAITIASVAVLGRRWRGERPDPFRAPARTGVPHRTPRSSTTPPRSVTSSASSAASARSWPGSAGRSRSGSAPPRTTPASACARRRSARAATSSSCSAATAP